MESESDLRDIVEAIRRHPRILGAVLIAWVAVFGWGLHSMTAGPPDLSSMTDASSPLSISHSAAAGYHQPSFTMNDLRDVAPHPSAPTVAPDPSVAQQQAQALQAAREGARTAAPRRVIVRPQTDGGAPETGPQHVLVVHPR